MHKTLRMPAASPQQTPLLMQNRKGAARKRQGVARLIEVMPRKAITMSVLKPKMLHDSGGEVSAGDLDMADARSSTHSDLKQACSEVMYMRPCKRMRRLIAQEKSSIRI